MSQPDQASTPDYAPTFKVTRVKDGYSVKLTMVCKQQGNLMFGTPSAKSDTAPPDASSDISNPVRLLNRIPVYGLPLNHRPVFESFAQEDDRFAKALAFLMLEGDFTIDLLNGFLTATGSAKAMDLDPDEALQSFSEFGKALDRLPFTLAKAASWHLPANLTLGALLLGAFTLLLVFPTPHQTLIGSSATLFFTKGLFIASLMLGLTLGLRFLFLKHPFRNFILTYTALGTITSSIILGPLFATSLNALHISKRATVTINSAQLNTEIKYAKNRSYTVYYLQADSDNPLVYEGETFTSFQLTQSEYNRLSPGGNGRPGTFTINVGLGLLDAPLRDTIKRVDEE